jgi:hypothetical protein
MVARTRTACGYLLVVHVSDVEFPVRDISGEKNVEKETRG